MRRRRPEKREILPDPVYNDLIVAKFINNLMKMGKKSLAEKIFYKSINKIQEKAKVDSGIELFKKAPPPKDITASFFFNSDKVTSFSIFLK